jgi:hypothetical protein
MNGQLYVARESFVAELDGFAQSFEAGKTLVREGHEILDRYPHLFEPAKAHYEVEQATAAPGERRKR